MIAEKPSTGSWLKAKRELAYLLSHNTYPTNKDEDFRYTDLSFLHDEKFIKLTSKASLQAFWNEQEIRSKSIDNCTISNLMETDSAEIIESNCDFVVSRNTLNFELGYHIRLNKNNNEDWQVLKLKHSSEQGETFFRHLIEAETGSKVIVVEEFQAENQALINSITEFKLSQGAQIFYIRRQEQKPESIHLGGVFATLAENADFGSVLLQSGGKLSRITGEFSIDGKQANCSLKGLATMDKTRHSDFTVSVRHMASNTTSSQTFHNLADDNASVAFTGLVHVSEGISGIEADQMNRSLLASHDAIAYSRPQLDILSDDVKCSHGSTTGRPDDDAIFYMRSRGITEKIARELQKAAFIKAVIQIPHAGLQKEITDSILHDNFQKDAEILLEML